MVHRGQSPEKKKKNKPEKDPNEIVWGLVLGGIVVCLLVITVLLTIFLGG